MAGNAPGMLKKGIFNICLQIRHMWLALIYFFVYQAFMASTDIFVYVIWHMWLALIYLFMYQAYVASTDIYVYVSGICR